MIAIATEKRVVSRGGGGLCKRRTLRALRKREALKEFAEIHCWFREVNSMRRTAGTVGLSCKEVYVPRS